jgi:hypothetical protein
MTNFGGWNSAHSYIAIMNSGHKSLVQTHRTINHVNECNFKIYLEIKGIWLEWRIIQINLHAL